MREPQPGTGRPGGDSALWATVAAAVYFVPALVAVAGLIPWKRFEIRGLEPAPWGDVAVLVGGMVAAMVASRAVAFSPSPLRAAWAAYVSHGAAAVATCALCAVVLAHTPRPGRRCECRC